MARTVSGTSTNANGYAPVNGLKMYYEMEGTGDPLVFIPPAFGFAGLESFPALVESHTVLTVDLQGNGRTVDIPERPLSIEQYAEDVVESFGGNTAVMIAVRYPEIVGRVATFGATYGPPQVALNPRTTHFDQPPAAESSYIQYQRENYQRVAPYPEYWPRIFDKLARLQWEGFSKKELASIQAPMLIALGDRDFVRLEHAVESFNLIPCAELAVIPDAGHFTLSSEPDKVIPVVKHFLEKPEKRITVATARTGFHPGETR
jgi:pimeloyl-ACP methyl ester carboxylesterase